MELKAQKFISVFGEIKETALHLLKNLWHSPLLLGYLVIGTIIPLCQRGMWGLRATAINLLILGLYAILIRMMTSKKPAEPLPVRRPKIELAAGLIWLALLFVLMLALSGLVHIPAPFFVKDFFNQIKVSTNNFHFPDWIISPIISAVIGVILELIPALLLFLVFGYGPGKMGLKPRCWKLTLVLLLSAPVMSLTLSGQTPLFEQPFFKTISFLLMILEAALPEELLLRGYLLPRFERVLKSPVNALVITSILFSAFHIPVHIHDGSDLLYELLNTFSVAFPSGLLWGYLYQRTRSIVPGMLFHASYGFLGSYFMSI